MRIYENHPNEDGTRSWRGRRDNYLVIIREVMNTELGHVDKYAFSIMKGAVNCDYSSYDEGKFSPTIEDCKNAALEAIEQDKQRVREEHIQYKKERRAERAKSRKDQGERT